MPLIPGDKLGPYEILAPIGAGGMGEVYKARDTRLDRTVAIKVLPEHIAKRDDLRARFEREARAVASLNHPNICVLHDIGGQDETGYMVMEFMEGDTLAERIAKGPIPMDQALKHALQIADALDRAHRAGVVHRDVKPQNIILTRDGVKILDFGLAKSSGSSAPSDATLTKVLTTEGTVMGTPQYMAPEQFEGREADTRSDIWAFGAVLYEMVTGQKAFQGKSYSSLVGAILSADPAPMAVKPFTPSWLERLVRRCLEKDPERRYQSMRDIRLDLETPPAETMAAQARPTRWPWALAALSMAFAAVAGTALFRQPAEPKLPIKLEVIPPAGSRFSAIDSAGGSAISPDGKVLAFVATNPKGESLLHLRSLDSLEVRAIPGTEDAGRPFWAPNSRSLAFVDRGKLKRLDLAGGAPIPLCNASRARGGDWSEDGTILFGSQLTGLQRVPATGGTPAPVTYLDKDESGNIHNYPQFLPGGKEFLFLSRKDDPMKSGIYIGALDGKPPVQILQTGFAARYDHASRRLLYMQDDGTLMARPMELNPPRLTGEAVAVAHHVGYAAVNRFVNFSVSANGSLFYGQMHGDATAAIKLNWHDRGGRLLETIGRLVNYRYQFSLSGDNSRVAYTSSAPAEDIYVLELARGVVTRITFSGRRIPQWSADGRYLYYGGPRGLFKKAADGSGQEEQILKSSVFQVPRAISPDEKNLLFGLGEIHLLRLGGEQKPEPYLKTEHNATGATFSPDGRWIAYQSNESGRDEIYVQGFPERRGKWAISAAGGEFPHWRGDGKELFWVGADGFLMAVSVGLEREAIRIGRPEPLFRMTGARNFEVARDGRRFLIPRSDSNDQPDLPMVVVQNWAAALPQ